MRQLLVLAFVLLAAPAYAYDSPPPERPVEEVAPPTIVTAQTALDGYLSDHADTYTAELLRDARVESVGPCRGDICQLRLTLNTGVLQTIRVQRHTRLSGWVIGNVAIPVESP